jgi:sarcosine oxidase gamma subunit
MGSTSSAKSSSHRVFFVYTRGKKASHRVLEKHSASSVALGVFQVSSSARSMLFKLEEGDALKSRSMSTGRCCLNCKREMH